MNDTPRAPDGCPPADDEDAPDDDATGFAFSRRTVLRTGAGLGTAAGLAGCSGLGVPDVTAYTFRATPAVLAPASSRSAPAYQLATRLADTVERTPTVVGRELDVEVTSEAAVYEGAVDTLGLLSTPTATVATRPQNPLATDSLRAVLVGQQADRVLSALTDGDRSSVTWKRGPTVVATGSGDLLGTTTDVKAFAGVTEESGFLLLTIARVTDAGDAVFAATAQQRSGGASALVGPDGYVDRATVRESVGRLESVLPRVERGGAGVRLTETARLAPTGGPDYVRVRLVNEYDERTLYGVRLLAQLFDDEGALLGVETATVPSLGADETFEGFVPYTVDGVAGYAVEGAHATRDAEATTSPDATVVSDERDRDTVAVTVENTGQEPLPFLGLEVAFYDDDGLVLARNRRNLAVLAAGERREYDVAFTPPGFQSPSAIADYAVDLREYGGGSARYVR